MTARQPLTDIEQYRRRKRRAGNFRWILIILFFLACATGGYFFSLSSFFFVTNITVSGNQEVSAERLRELSGIRQGQNIFTVDKEQVAEWLTIEPMIKEATVEKRLPQSINITVVERVPVAVLSTGKAFVQVDDTGLVLRRHKELAELSLPFISGVTDFPAGILPGSTITDKTMQVALTVIGDLPPEAFATITEIDVSDTQKIKLYTAEGIEVRLGGTAELKEKYVTAANIIQDLQNGGKAATTQYIDVSSAVAVIYPAPMR